MLKIGFIDYYLDEWHANNYPEFFRKHSDGRYGVAYAYGKIDSPHNGLTNKAWAEKNGIELVPSIQELIEKSDRIIVLAPNNPETHEELTALALQSGKRVYVDKTFATDKASAQRIFENAESHNTCCYSSSALRFSSELADFDSAAIDTVYSEGPGVYEIYSIHQIEPIVSLMKCRAKRVMFTGSAAHPSMVIEFEDGRHASMYQCSNIPFRITAANSANSAVVRTINSDYFGLFIDSLIKFFDDGIVPVPHSQTIDVIAIRAAGMEAMKSPFRWVEV